MCFCANMLCASLHLHQLLDTGTVIPFPADRLQALTTMDELQKLSEKCYIEYADLGDPGAAGDDGGDLALASRSLSSFAGTTPRAASFMSAVSPRGFTATSPHSFSGAHISMLPPPPLPLSPLRATHTTKYPELILENYTSEYLLDERNLRSSVSAATPL